MASLESVPWAGDWAWGVPLVVANVLMHVVGLNLIGLFVLAEYTSILRRRSHFGDFVAVVGLTALLTISLRALESATWGAAYLLLGALSDERTAMLYSLGAMTTYGHSNIHLNSHWELLGAMEALQGMLLFGLTTAFLFSIFHEVSPLRNSQATIIDPPWRAGEGEKRQGVKGSENGPSNKTAGAAVGAHLQRCDIGVTLCPSAERSAAAATRR